MLASRISVVSWSSVMVGSKKLSIYLGGVCRPIDQLFTMEPILNRTPGNLNPHLPVRSVRLGVGVCRGSSYKRRVAQ
jgi:hypothetical protein